MMVPGGSSGTIKCLPDAAEAVIAMHPVLWPACLAHLFKDMSDLFLNRTEAGEQGMTFMLKKRNGLSFLDLFHGGG